MWESTRRRSRGVELPCLQLPVETLAEGADVSLWPPVEHQEVEAFDKAREGGPAANLVGPLLQQLPRLVELFQSGKVVRGLAMMTAALERATPADQIWIRGMQEEAFSLAGEADRRTAISLAQDILGKGSTSSQ